MLLIGDSTLLAVDRYNGYRALRGFDYMFDAKSCRTLGIPSCGKRPLPPNAVEAIGKADGDFDYVVVMAGYDEWWTSFPDSFDEVVAAARAKGSQRIIWLTYREGVTYKLLTGEPADEAFVKNNQTLRDKVASGAFPDVLLAHLPMDCVRRRAAVPHAGRARRNHRINLSESRHPTGDRRHHRPVSLRISRAGTSA